MITTATFTKTELKIIKCLADGCPPVEVAKRLEMRIETYWDHKNNINKKFGTSNLQLLTHWAIAYGVVRLKTWDEIQGLLGFPQPNENTLKKGLDKGPGITYTRPAEG